MSGLVLKLSPHERVLINGAVIENSERRSRISIMTPNANILRLKDALHPDMANTPVRRVCYIAQLVLSGDAHAEEARLQLIRGIEQLNQVFVDCDSKALLDHAGRAAFDRQFYSSLKALRALLPQEARLFAVGNA